MIASRPRGWLATGRRLGLLAGLTVASTAALGTLPYAVDGQPLPSLAPMLERAQPAVVNIATRARQSSGGNPLLRDPFFERYYTPSPRGRGGRSLGAGIVLDAQQGYIVTNHHVIEDAGTIEVTLFDGRELEARLVGGDPDTDIAVLRVEAEGLVAMPLGDSDVLRVGDFVVAIGNPFGLSQTVTSGIISALGRRRLGIEDYEDFIQTDAAINVGNSGGALINLRGELIGINTAIIAPGNASVGIAFAIPINMARRLTDQLIAYGEIRRGRLGVYIRDPGEGQPAGALVTQVVDDSPAERAGIVPGDVVVEVDDRSVVDAADLRNTVGLVRAGTVVRLDVVRGGERLRFDVEVAAAPDKPVLTMAMLEEKLAGAVLEAGESGVRVGSVDEEGAAWKTGLRPGDLIVAANRRRVTRVEEIRDAVDGESETLVLYVERQGAPVFLVLR